MSEERAAPTAHPRWAAPAISRTVAEDIRPVCNSRIGFGLDPDADLRPPPIPEPQQVVVLENDLGDTLVVDEGTVWAPLMPEDDYAVLHP